MQPMLITTSVLKKPKAQFAFGKTKTLFSTSTAFWTITGALMGLWFSVNVFGYGWKPGLPFLVGFLSWFLTTPAASPLPGEPLTRWISLKVRGVKTTMELNGEPAHIVVLKKSAQPPSPSVPLVKSGDQVAYIVPGRKASTEASVAFLGNSPITAPILGKGMIVFSHYSIGPGIVNSNGVRINKKP
jgi:hypothetical protein